MCILIILVIIHNFDNNSLMSVNGVEVDPDNLDERASNGVVHFIDEVIYPIPTGSIIDTLKADRR